MAEDKNPTAQTADGKAATDTAALRSASAKEGDVVVWGTVRQNVLLKSGNGTVAIEDYDEKIHGKAVEETDEQYAARINARKLGASAPHPLTSLPNLATFDTAALTPPVALPAVPTVAQPVATQRVAPETAEQTKAREESAAKAQAAATDEARRLTDEAYARDQRARERAQAAGTAPAAAARPGGAAPGAGTTSGELAHQDAEANKATGKGSKS